jgi:ferric-dicitrate binding protein FerR (iron transport regulator)
MAILERWRGSTREQAAPITSVERCAIDLVSSTAWPGDVALRDARPKTLHRRDRRQEALVVLVGHKRAIVITVLDRKHCNSARLAGVTETALAFIPYLRDAC